MKELPINVYVKTVAIACEHGTINFLAFLLYRIAPHLTSHSDVRKHALPHRRLVGSLPNRTRDEGLVLATVRDGQRFVDVVL